MTPDTRVTPIISTYVPQFVIKHLKKHGNMSLKPTQTEMNAVVMLVNISGFSKVIEELANNSNQELTQLTNFLNDYFGILIDQITDFNGDIVKFAGDTLLSIWPITHHEQESSIIAKVISCAKHMESNTLKTISDTTLNLCIGINIGPLSIMHLGGVYNRFEPLVIGESLSLLSNQLEQIQSAKILITKHLLNKLNTNLIHQLALTTDSCSNDDFVILKSIANPVNNDWPKEKNHIESNSNENDHLNLLQDYLPAAIKQRLTAGHTAWLSEFRRVSILYIRIPHIDSTVSLTRIQRIMKNLQVALYRYEGSLNRLSFDHNGIILLAVFGLPPLAHEDDPLRAIKTSRGIIKSLKTINETASIGISTGRLFCAAIGNNRRREYTPLGYQGRIAYDLMTHGGVNILCDQATYDSTSQYVKFSDQITIQFKDKPDLIAYAPETINNKKSLQTHINLSGRDQELSTLENALHKLLNNEESNIVFVTGEAGIGKSQLLEVFYRQVKQTSATALIGVADAIEKNSSYFSWKRVFSERLGIKEQDNSHTWVDRIYGHLSMGHDLVRLAPLLNAVLPIEIPENDLTLQMSGEGRAANTEYLLLELLKLSAEAAPLVIILDDAHWMDSNSWRLAWQTSQIITPILLVIFTRPLLDQPAKEYRQLNSLHNCKTINLESLNKAEILELVSHRLGVDSIPQKIANFIYQRAEGHPYFSEELSYELRDKKVLKVHNGECKVNETNFEKISIELPDNIQGVITSRIDDLDPELQITVKVASIIGREFSLEELISIYPFNTDDIQNINIEKGLSELIKCGLLCKLSEKDQQFSFKHIITKEVAYSLMTFNQKKSLHKKLAMWYERQKKDDLVKYYPILAYHWSITDTPEKSIEYLEFAASQALREFANSEVINFLSQADKICKENNLSTVMLSRQAKWIRMIGEAEQALGRPISALKKFQLALEHLGYQIPPNQNKLVFALISQALLQIRFRLQKNRSNISDHEEKQKELIEAARIFERLFEIYWFTGDIGRLIYSCLSAVNLCEKSGLMNEVTAMSYSNLSVIVGGAGFNKQADYYASYAMNCVDQIKSTPALIWVQIAIGTLEVNSGRWQARERFIQGRKLSLELGDRRKWELHTASIATVQTISGLFNDGLNYYQQLFDSGLRRGDSQTQHWGLLGLCKNLYGLQRYNELESLMNELKESGANFGNRNDLINQLDYYALTSLIDLSKKKFDETANSLNKAIPLMERFTQYIFLPVIGLLADAVFNLWMQDSSKQYHKNCEKWAKRIIHWSNRFSKDFIIGLPRYYFIQGQYAYTKNNIPAAIKAWQTSLKHAKQLEMPYDQARARWLLAYQLKTSDPKREDLEQKVRHYYKSIGVDYKMKLDTPLNYLSVEYMA